MKPIFSRFLLICLGAVVAFGVAACGNKGPLVPPKSALSVNQILR